MLLLLTTVLGGVILYCVHYLISKKITYWETRGFPFLNGGMSQVFQSIKGIFYPTKCFEEHIVDMYNGTKGYKFCGLTFMTTPKLFIRDPDLVYSVLVKDFSHFCDRQFPVDEEGDPLSGHLFFLKGDRWRGLRKKMVPTFTSGKLKLMFSQVADCADEVITYVKGKSGPIEVKALMNCFTLNVTGSVAFGMKVEALKCLDGEKSEFVDLAQGFFRSTPLQNLRMIIFMQSRIVSKLLGIKFVEKETNDFFINVIKDNVKHRMETGTKRNDFLQLMMNIMEKDDGNVKQPSDRTDLQNDHHDDNDKELLENAETLKHNTYKYKFTENTLAANSFTFIVGGSETVATVITFALYELSENQHVLSKLQDEVDNFLSDQKFDYSAINSLPYLDTVINETIRKHPPVPNLDRVCVQDYKIPGTNYIIKKGEELFVPVVALHNDPDFFPDPETFDPDRFLETNTIKKGTYLPFGAGPRFCIAMRFALMEVKIFVAKTVKQYNLKLHSKLPLTFSKVARIKTITEGLWIEFEPRS